jgi:glycosyltransferase involved in cell wall biosynthesis
MIEEKKIANTTHINSPTSHIGKEYAKSSMLVMSSHYEGFPMVMIEAMACGLPVVTFDYKCGPRDIIDHEGNGLLVKDGDIEGLAAALMRLMDDKVLRQKMGENAKRVVERYSEDKVMREWQNLYKKLLD